MPRIAGAATALMVGLMLSGSMAAAGERVERNYDKTFQVTPGAQLDLEHGDGDVTLTPWDRDEVRIQVAYRAMVGSWGAGRRSQFEVEFRQSGDTLRVVGREPSFHGIGWFSSRDYSYIYEIQAPSYLQLRLSGDDGDLEISGWRAPVRVRLEDGDVRIRDLEAPRLDIDLDDGDIVVEGARASIEIESEDGDVRISDCQGDRIRLSTDDGELVVRRCGGDFEVSSSDGSLRLVEIVAGKLDVRTDDGDLRLELARALDLDLTIHSEDGDVEVVCPGDLSASLEVLTGDGRIDVELPGADLSRSRRRVSGLLGGGAGRIAIRTDDGDVRLTAAR